MFCKWHPEGTTGCAQGSCKQPLELEEELEPEELLEEDELDPLELLLLDDELEEDPEEDELEDDPEEELLEELPEDDPHDCPGSAISTVPPQPPNKTVASPWNCRV